VVALNNGIRTIFKASADLDHVQMQDSLLNTVLYLLNEPACRPYVRLSCDLQVRYIDLADLYIPLYLILIRAL
jgi:hypothetical protein